MNQYTPRRSQLSAQKPGRICLLPRSRGEAAPSSARTPQPSEHSAHPRRRRAWLAGGGAARSYRRAFNPQPCHAPAFCSPFSRIFPSEGCFVALPGVLREVSSLGFLLSRIVRPPTPSTRSARRPPCRYAERDPFFAFRTAALCNCWRLRVVGHAWWPARPRRGPGRERWRAWPAP